MIEKLILLFICSVGARSSNESTEFVKLPQNAIYDKLLDGYKKDMRPNIASKQPINVTIDLVLYSLEETDELRQSLAFNIWFHMEWADPAFRWNSSEFDDINQIEVLPTEIWMPDLYLKGVRESKQVPSVETTACDVYSHGVIHCEFNKRLTAHCDYHIAKFPYDTQNCTLEFGSWKYGMSHVDIYTNSTEGNVKFFKPNNEWELVSFDNRRIVKASSRDSFAKIFYDLIIKRKPIHYVMILILPSFLITTLALLGLFSPFSSTGERQERVTMGLTMLLTMSVLLLVVSEQMPQSSTGFPPLLGFYILFEFFLGAFGTCCTIAIMHIQQKSFKGKSPPNWLCFLLCLQSTDQKQKNDDYDYFLKNENCEQYEPSEKDQEPVQTKEPSGGEQSKTLMSCLENLEEVTELINKKEREAELSDKWRLICSRIDVICAVLLLSINCFSLVYILISQ